MLDIENKIVKRLTELLGTQKIKLEFDKVYVFQAPKARYVLTFKKTTEDICVTVDY